MSRFEPFVQAKFGTLTIEPIGESCVRLYDMDTEEMLVLTFEEAEELRDILVEITIASRPSAKSE